MGKKLSLLLLALCWGATCLHAEGQDTGCGVVVEVSKKVCKGLDASVEAEYRTQNGLSVPERVAIGAGLDYKINKWLKADMGYTALVRNIVGHYTQKYYQDQYGSPRHRAYLSVNGSYEVAKHWTLSLRERYQYTYETRQLVRRWNDAKGERASDKVVGKEGEHLLRSRLQIKWGRKKCPLSPYANIEMLNDLQEALAIDQMRYTAGCDYKINKHNGVGLSYRFKDKSDKDEAKGHLFTLKYEISF